MGNSLGTPSSRESGGMAEATPGTANSGERHGMAEATPGIVNSGKYVEWWWRLQVGSSMEWGIA